MRLETPSSTEVCAPFREVSASTVNTRPEGAAVPSAMDTDASVKVWPASVPDTARVSDPSAATVSEAVVRSKVAEADRLPAGMVMLKPGTAV